MACPIQRQGAGWALWNGYAMDVRPAHAPAGAASSVPSGDKPGGVRRRILTASGPAMPQWIGQPALAVARVSGQERLCDLFEYEVELRTTDADAAAVPGGPAAQLDKAALTGRALTIAIALDGSGVDGVEGDGPPAGQREISGLVASIAGPTPEGRHLVYRFVLRPWLWLATLTRDYRIYQQKTVIEILDALLADYAFPVEKRLSMVRYPPRTYQVQYGETDFEFFQRLTQEWGIAWFFEHDAGHHRLILTDGNGAFRCFANRASHAMAWHPGTAGVDTERITAFTVVDQLVTGKWRSSDYDFVKPRADLTVQAQQPRETAHADREIYEWPGDHAQAASGNEPWQEGDMIARIRMEALRQHGRRAHGRGNLRVVVPGCTFALTHHPEQKANGEYLVIATTLHLEDMADEGAIAGGQPWHCEVAFEVQPTSETFRPDRTQPKPRTTGPQTATVVGPDDLEVWTDQYARVKVRMHWDTRADRDESSSCWVRVASPWHGDEFGAIQIPRTGQEVIVDFLHGDPDLPLIVGSVPNPLNMPPWSLPGQHALSGFRSRELGGGRHNHLVMDDTQGEIQAQLSSDHLLSQLNLGHITRIPDAAGRKDKRGEGAELRTDGTLALRSAKGTLLSTEARPDAQGHALDMGETIQRLKQALELAQALQDAARQAQAQLPEHEAAVQGMARQHDALRHGTDMAAPHLVVSSAAGIAATAAESTHLHSARHASLTAGEHVSISAGRSLIASVRDLVSLCAHKLGIRLFASHGPVEIQAQTDTMDLLAKLGISIVSTEDSIRVIARKELLVGGGGSYTRYDASGIKHLTQGNYTAHAAQHAFTEGQGMTVRFPATPQTAAVDALLRAVRSGSALAAV